MFSRQLKLLNMLKSLGYPVAPRSLPVGIALIGMDYMLRGEAKKFNEIMDFIAAASSSIIENANTTLHPETHLRLLDTKSPTHQGPSDEKKKLFEIIGFFDALQLHLKPAPFQLLFNSGSLTRYQEIPSLKTGTPAKNKLTVNNQPCIGTTQELANYVATLIELTHSDNYFKKSFSLAFEISTPDRVITFSYDQEKALWSYLNPQHLRIKFVNTEELMTLLQIALTKGSNYFASSIKIFTLPEHRKETDHLIARFRDTEAYRQLHEIEKKADLETTDKVNLLHIAAQHNHIKVIDELLKYKNEHIDNMTRDGSTPILLAAENRHTETIEILLMHGANINQRGKLQLTPLLLASDAGDFHLIQLLLSAGADPCVKAFGVSAKDIAKKNGHTHLEKILHAAEMKWGSQPTRSRFQSKRAFTSIQSLSSNRFTYFHRDDQNKTNLLRIRRKGKSSSIINISEILGKKN